MIRVVIPPHIRELARVGGELELRVEGPATQRSVLAALESGYPMLRGTIRDHVTEKRRPFVRFFACEEDISNAPPDAASSPATGRRILLSASVRRTGAISSRDAPANCARSPTEWAIFVPDGVTR